MGGKGRAADVRRTRKRNSVKLSIEEEFKLT